MLFSICTPTNNATYLKELYESITAQTYDKREWILVLNGWLDYSDIDDAIINDNRVKPTKYNKETTSVWELKKFTFSLWVGDVLVEVDHDDMITPDCLEELAKAFEDETVGFAYSDNAKLGKFTPYNPKHWRKHTMFNWKGEDLYSMNSLPITPLNMGYIWFMADHVRAWRRETYHQLWGHDASLEVLDDQDLIQRTFLESRIVHIPKTLYIYRIREDGGNTWLQKNKKIQQETVRMYDRRIYQLAMRWSELNWLRKIDLCWGINKQPGRESIDLEGADITADLDKKRPLKDGSVGVIRAHDALEHLKDKMHTMSEIHRVLAKWGILLSMTPSTDGRGARQDPTHCCYSEDTEILTTEWFKLFSELTGDEIVYTYDKETWAAIEQPIEVIHEYDYTWKMVHFTWRAVDCLVTPNHNMFVGSSDDYSELKFRTAEDIMENLSKTSSIRLVANAEFWWDYPEYFEIPNSQVRLLRNPKKWFVNDPIKLPIEPFMEFMWWRISEWWVTIKQWTQWWEWNYFRIWVSQSQNVKPEHYNRIWECLVRLWFEPNKNSNWWYLSNKPFALWLQSLGKQPVRYIPTQIKQMHPDLLKIMLESLMLWDWTYQWSYGTYATTSKQLADDVQEIAIKCWYRVTQWIEKRIWKIVFCNPDYRAKYDMRLIYISKTKSMYLTNRDYVDYNGKVYCVTVKDYNVILVRRNWKTIWSWNSFWNENAYRYWIASREQPRFIRNTTVLFREGRLYTYFPSEFHKKHNISYVVAHLEKI